MPEETRRQIRDTARALEHILDQQDHVPEDEKAAASAIISLGATLLCSLDRIADACERTAQALEDEHKIHHPQTPKSEYPILRTCSVCGLALPRGNCGMAECPQAL